MNNSLFDKDFALIIGPPRSGISELHAYFKDRGDVAVPYDVREIFYFDRHFQRGPEFYRAHFDVQERHRMVMELSTTAFDHADAPDRAYELLGGNIRLVFLLRHPVERALAVYQDLLRYGIVKGDIVEAAGQAPQILTASRYAEHYGRWAARFGQDNSRIFLYEELQARKKACLSEICAYLSLPYKAPSFFSAAGFWGQMGRILKAPAPGDTQEARVWLADRLGGEIENISNISGLSFPAWIS